MAVEIHLSDPTADPDNCVDTRDKLDRHLTSHKVRPGHLEKTIELVEYTTECCPCRPAYPQTGPDPRTIPGDASRGNRSRHRPS